MKQNDTKGKGGISILGLLGVVFVALKLMGYIDWSWWWVTLPFWGVPALLIAVLLTSALIVGLITIYEYWQEEKTKKK